MTHPSTEPAWLDDLLCVVLPLVVVAVAAGAFSGVRWLIAHG